MKKAMQKMILSSSIVILVSAAASIQGLAQSSQKSSESDQSLVKNQPMVAVMAEGVSIASADVRTTTTVIDRPKSFSFALPAVSDSLKPAQSKGWDQLSANEKNAFNQQLGGSAVKWTVPETSQTADASKTKPFVFVNRGPQPLQH
jgi:hypothetical protein